MRYLTPQNFAIMAVFLILALLIFDRIIPERVEIVTPPASSIDNSVPAETPAVVPNRHADIIASVDADAGMFLSRVATLIIRDEAKRTHPYLDTKNNVTIGVGRNLSGNGISVEELHQIVKSVDYRYLMNNTSINGSRVYIKSLSVAQKVFADGLIQSDVQLLLVHDLNRVRAEAEQVFGEVWSRLDSVRREAILDVLFNLGLTHFKEFHKFIASVKKQDWQVAATELLLSQAARENIARYHRNATVIQTGDAKYFELK